MQNSHKLITRALWIGLLLVFVGVIGARCVFTPSKSNLPELYPAASFSLHDEHGNVFGSSDLAGHPYVAAFIFTRCAASCPVVSARMEQLQQRTNSKLMLVSISVDPAFDTPAVLEKYAQGYNADESRWHFLTGTPEQIAAAEQGMKLISPPPDRSQGDGPIVHSDHILLIDGRGIVRGVYDSGSFESMNQLAIDANSLAGWSLFP